MYALFISTNESSPQLENTIIVFFDTFFKTTMLQFPRLEYTYI